MSDKPEIKFVAVLVPPVYDLKGRPFYYDKKWKRTPRRPPTAFRGRPPINWKPPVSSSKSEPAIQRTTAIRATLTRILMAVAKKAGVTVLAANDPDVGLVVDGIAVLFGGKPQPSKKTVTDAVIRYHVAQILAAVTLMRTWHQAWMDSPLPVKATEVLDVRVGNNSHGTTQQLKSLLLAANNGRDTRLEVQWRQTTPAARFVLKRSLDGMDDATVIGLVAKQPTAGDMISTPIPPRGFLVAVLPLAIGFAGRRHGTVFDREEELLLTCRTAFLAVHGGRRDFMTVGRISHPEGKGADFVRAVEELFGVSILACNSHKMIKRVRATTKRRGYRW